jgi:hypothetical protein
MTSAGEKLLASAPSLLQNRLRDELKRMSETESSVLLKSLTQVATLMEAERPAELDDGG